MKSSAKRLVRIAIITALYVALSLAIAPLTFGLVQIRFAEMLVLLCFYNRDYCYSMILGCLLVNLFSPLGWIDVLFGTLSSLIAVVLIRFCPRDYLAFIPPTICTIAVALEFYFVLNEPFWLAYGTIMLGEFIAVGLIGTPIFMLLSKKQVFLNLIGADERYFAMRDDLIRKKKYRATLRELRKSYKINKKRDKNV